MPKPKKPTPPAAEPEQSSVSMQIAIDSALASFEHNIEAVTALVENAKPLLVAKDATHDVVREGRLELYRTRTAIERKRKELKQPILEYGRRVDEHAAALTSVIEPTEKALLERESALAAEIERQKAEAERIALEALEARREAFKAVGVDMPLWAVKAMSEEDYLAELAAAQKAHAEAKALEEQRRRAVAEERAAEQRKAREASEEAARLRAELEEARAALARERAAKAPAAEPVVEHPPLSSLTPEERVVAEATSSFDVTLTPEQAARLQQVAETPIPGEEGAENVEFDDPDFYVKELDERPVPPAVSERMAAEAQRQEQITAQVEDGAPSRSELWESILEARDVLGETPVDEERATQVWELLVDLCNRREAV